jgi:hypothetical protein
VTRYLTIISLLWVGLYPQLISCGTPRSADRTVRLDDPASAEFVTTLALEIPYGETADTFGYIPAGDEQEARGPNSFLLADDGKIQVRDPVRGVLFAFDPAAGATPKLETIAQLGPRPDQVLLGPDSAPAARVIKTSAETGEVIFERADEPRRVEIDVGGPLASLRLLGVDRGGRALVLVERFRELGQLAVDRELLAVGPEAGLVARRALDDAPAVPPLREFFLADDGLYRMVAGERAVVFTRYEVQP